MSGATDRSGVPWVVAGTAFLLLMVVLMWHFRQEANPARELALKASRADLVGQMEARLTAASEAEKSAVLAVTDQESQDFAGQARAATAQVEKEREELSGLLQGNKAEQDLLARFSEAFANLRRVDDEVLRLAVQNTNLKASALLFGPAAETVAQLEAALARATAKRPAAQGPASAARIALLHVQALFAPHIAEESDAKMDQLEASMDKEMEQARKAFDGLAASLKGDPDFAAARAAFARFEELKKQILALSRENTNVRSLALSLNQKRKAMIECLAALGALRQAILDEPIAGVTYGRPAHPR